MTTAGAVTLFPLSSFSSKSPHWLYSLAAGADGNLWFTESVGHDFVIGRMSPSGVVSRFSVGNLSSGIVANGPNGSLIVTGQNAKGQNEVYGVSTAGSSTRYKVPAAISNAFFSYLGSADGSLWFSNAFGAIEIGRITASGVATSHNLGKIIRGQYGIRSMAVGQDGNLYVPASVLGARGHVTTKVYPLSPSKLTPVRGVGGRQSRG